MNHWKKSLAFAAMATTLAAATACGDSKPPMVPDGPNMTPTDASSSPADTATPAPSGAPSAAPSDAPAASPAPAG